MRSPRIVLVDTNPDVLDAATRAFRHQPYECVGFHKSSEALDYLSCRRVQVAVIELRSPDMDGVELLRRVERLHPDVIRVATSEGVDPAVLLSLIEEGRIYRYIIKPWDNTELVCVIRQAVELFWLRRQRRELAEELACRNLQLEQRVEERTERLTAIEKEAELGKYTSQIVHSLKVPLQSIGGAALMANLRLSDGDPVHRDLRRYLDSVLSSAGELQKVIAGIIAHTANEHFMRKDRVDVNQIVRREVEFFDLDQEYKHRIVKLVELDDDIPPILGNPLQIKQIVDNLITNAIDAMEESASKQLTVRTGVVADTILISVADTGCGIPADHIEQLFSPYFTTKPLGKGTGIGLASVRKMVESYGGTIVVESAVGRGATFTVRLPVWSPPDPDDGEG